MKPILFDFGAIKVYSYGLFLALAFLASLIVARKAAKEKNLDPDLMYDLVILSALFGVIGGRVSYVAYNWKEYAGNPLSILYFSQGGLTIYGGFALALLVGSVWVFYKRLSWFMVADIVALAMPLGIAIARVGCFLNGCCYGTATEGPFGVVFPALSDFIRRHPTQIYELIYALAIFFFLWSFRMRFTRDGDIFFSFIGIYGFFRIFNEFLRVNPDFFLGLTGSQLVSVLAIAISLGYFLIWRGRSKKVRHRQKKNNRSL